MDIHTSRLLQFFQQGPFPAQQALDIALLFTEKTVDKNELLLTAGQVSNEYLFLESGFMRAYVHDIEGREVTTNFMAPGNVVVEPSSFFNRVPTQENIQALENSTGWFITFEQLNHLFHAYPAFREFGRSILVRVLTGLKDRTLSMITQTGEQRYQQLVRTNPTIFQHAPLKQIASYLGITDSSLSRIRKELSKK
ncbi:Crp/Fnr family transcriptional regulator [Paraflavitalea pollutisoli]|uniref:Crp/Fnr family transcriptional regulator n=1 Tax=Paraflavitalea pollutisoli TaxID=3034143 RepID=UPI0023EBC77B|nr:Crp/Fnr family transcriptional regulator [Paraflavitalea sp. H1-2-19X]